MQRSESVKETLKRKSDVGRDHADFDEVGMRSEANFSELIKHRIVHYSAESEIGRRLL